MITESPTEITDAVARRSTAMAETDTAQAALVLARVIDLQLLLDQYIEVNDAVDATARWLAEHLQARQVFVGFAPDPLQPCEVIAVRRSDLEQAASNSNEVSPTEQAAIEEVMLRREPVWHPAKDAADDYCSMAVTDLAGDSAAESVFGFPLHDEQAETRGVVLIIDGPERPGEIGLRSQLETLSTPLVAKWMRLRDRQPGRLQRSVDAVSRHLALTTSRVFIGGFVVLCLLMMVPMTYRIRCGCELQPTGKRYLVAPVDGPLEDATAHAGDRVRRGEVLATMNASEIDLQLAALEAEFAKSRKTADSYLAENRVSDTQLAELEAQRIELESDLLRHRRDLLQLKSPIDGVVISGDLRDSGGAPLSRGQQLLELAPLGKQRVEVALPQSEIAFANAGNAVQFRLHAFPGQEFSTTIERIHPTAEVRDGANVFIAEATIEDPDHLLRPGMQGRAWVKSGRAAVGWILFHRPIAQARVWLGW